MCMYMYVQCSIMSCTLYNVYTARLRDEEKGPGTHCLRMHVIIMEKSCEWPYDVMAFHLFSVSKSRLSTRAKYWCIYKLQEQCPSVLPLRKSKPCNRTGSYIAQTDYKSILIPRNVRNIMHMCKQCVPGPFSSPSNGPGNEANTVYAWTCSQPTELPQGLGG